jgi:AcrR family transcriptional regulator
MGNREDLLDGATKCLLDKGFLRTTARDIAAASGVSLAAIGYHFGSKEALLSSALVRAIGEWADQVGGALPADGASDADPIARFESAWAQTIDSLPEYRKLWAVQFEVIAHLDDLPEVRAAFIEAQREGRLGMAALIHGVDPGQDEDRALRIGTFYQALLIGIAVQWHIDPGSAPAARDLADTLRLLTAPASPAAE